jgi:RNA polymerase sigma-70 factor, ECF subfamily
MGARIMDVSSTAVSTPKSDLGPYNRLIIVHQDNLYTLAYRVLGDEAAAGEVVEAALLQAYRRIDLLRSPVLVWLYRYTVQACRERVRRMGKPVPESDPGEEPLHFLLNRLPFDLRLAVVLVDVMELDYIQAAAAMNTNPRSVSRLVAQARRSLSG